MALELKLLDSMEWIRWEGVSMGLEVIMVVVVGFP